MPSFSQPPLTPTESKELPVVDYSQIKNLSVNDVITEAQKINTNDLFHGFIQELKLHLTTISKKIDTSDKPY